MKKTLFIYLTIVFLFSIPSFSQQFSILRGLHGTINHIEETSYDVTMRNGRILQGEELKKTQIELKFDSVGQLTEEISTNDKGTGSKSVYHWDKNKLCIKKEFYNLSDGRLTGTITYHYDTTSNCIEAHDYSDDGTLNLRTIFVYDENNNLIEERQFYPEGNACDFYQYRYDNNYNLIERDLYYQGELYKTEFYNNDGEIAKEIIHNSLGEIYTYEYTYDHYNNWTQAIIYRQESGENNAPVPWRIMTREIDYKE